MNRANLVVPASKAARSKIARNRNGTANSASANNKAVINKEASSKAGDRSSYIRLFDGRRQLPHLFVRVPIAFSSTLLQLPRSYRAILFSVKSSTQDKIKGEFRKQRAK